MESGIDSNHDGYVDKEELIKWILDSFKSLAIEEATERLIEEDLNKDGYISWMEHFKNNFESDEFETTDDMLIEDKILWKAADSNQDELLNVTEFAAFLSPEDFESMSESLYILTMERKDKNKDSSNQRSSECRKNDSKLHFLKRVDMHFETWKAQLEIM